MRRKSLVGKLLIRTEGGNSMEEIYDRAMVRYSVFVVVIIVWLLCSLGVERSEEYSEKRIQKHNEEIQYLDTEEEILTVVGKEECMRKVSPLMESSKEFELKDDKGNIVTAEVSKRMYARYFNGDKIKARVTKSSQGNIAEAYLVWK